jgi:hypothetical protein
MRGGRRRREAATEGQAVWRGTDALWVCDDAAVYRGGGEGSSGKARDRGEAVCDAVCGSPGGRGAAAEESQAAGRASAGAREERNGGAGGVEGRQILEEQSILEGIDHVQMYVSSVGVQARKSATEGSPPPSSGVRRSDRWTALSGAPPCDMDLAGSTAVLQGVGKMEAGSEHCKEPDDEKLLRVVCRWIEICRFDGKVGRFC